MNLRIVYFNDVHGYIEPHPDLFYDGSRPVVREVGGYGRIAGYLQRIRSESPEALVFDGGDTFHGTLPLLDSEGEALVPVLRKMKVDAMVGHWDFAYGPRQLSHLASQLGYPVLGINVHKEDGTPFLPPYILKNVGGLKVAVIGICCNIIGKSMPDHFSTGLTITDGIEELPGAIEAARDEGAQFIILLSHNGFPQDVYLLNQVSGVDLCLSAHTHNRLYQAATVKDTPVVQCGCHGATVGDLRLEIDGGKLVDFRYDLVEMDESVPVDEEVAAMVEEIMAPYRALQADIVGHTDQILHRYDTLNASMDDMMLAALRLASGAPLAFSNGWRYGAPIAPGPISRWQLYNIIPMNPPVSVVELTGEEIRGMLEANLERTFSREPMEQMGGYAKRCAGVSVKMRMENPSKNRIHELYAGPRRLQPDEIYQAAFVTVQGVPPGLGRNRHDLPVHAIDAMVRFLQTNDPYKADGAPVFSLV